MGMAPKILLNVSHFLTEVPKKILDKQKISFFPINSQPILSYILERLLSDNLLDLIICGNEDETCDFIKKNFPQFNLIYFKCKASSLGDIMRECGRRITNEENLEGDYINFEDISEKILNLNINPIRRSTTRKYSADDFKEIIFINGNTLFDMSLKPLLKSHRKNVKKDINCLITTFLYETHYTEIFRLYGISENKINFFSICNKNSDESENAEDTKMISEVVSKIKDIDFHSDLSGFNLFVCSSDFFQIFKENFDYKYIEDLVKGLIIFNPNGLNMYALRKKPDNRP